MTCWGGIVHCCTAASGTSRQPLIDELAEGPRSAADAYWIITRRCYAVTSFNFYLCDISLESRTDYSLEVRYAPSSCSTADRQVHRNVRTFDRVQPRP